MSTTIDRNEPLAAQLARNRADSFIGRAAEKRLFTRLLESDGSLRVLFFSGSGGIGKTCLLHELERMAGQRDVPCLRLDARGLPHSPADIRQALGFFLQDDGEASVKVLLIDTVEVLAPLEGWFRDTLLPGLSQRFRVVLCGRNPPASEWQVDPGWTGLLRVVDLAAFTEVESGQYLQCRGVPMDRQGHIRAFARGYPLALGLAADIVIRRPDADLPPEAASKILHRLMVNLLRGIEGDGRLQALRAAAVVRVLSEALLAAMLGRREAIDLYAWLQGLSFIHIVRRGLVMHALVREAITDYMHRQHPLRHERMLARAHHFLARQMVASGLGEREQWALDIFYVQRDTPLVQAVYRFDDPRMCYCDRPRTDDWAGVREMLLRHEGEESCRYLDHWYARQPEGLVAVRDRRQSLVGFLYMLEVNRVAASECAFDPVVARFCAYLETRPPLKPGQRAVLFRSWMAADGYQVLSPVQTQVCAFILFYTLSAHDLAFVLHLQPDTTSWTRISEQCGHTRLPGEPVAIGGFRNALYAHDYRSETPAEWISGLHRHLRGRSDAAAPQWDETAFSQAIRQALKDYVNPDALSKSPLMGCAMLSRDAPPSGPRRVRSLQTLLRSHCERLATTPKTEPLYRVLHRSYLEPARNQALAAEALYLSERTYRRRLAQAVKAVSLSLWGTENELT